MKSFGITNKNVLIGVRHYPDRQRPCLVVERGNCATVLGTFSNETMVEEFEKALIELFGEPEDTTKE